MMAMTLESDEIKRLARELGAYFDFDHTANAFMDSSIEQIPLSFTDILYNWARVLYRQKAISESAALCFNPDTAKLDLILPSNDSKKMWHRLLNSELGKRIAQRICAHQAFSCLLPKNLISGSSGNRFLIVASCPGSQPPAALAASCGINEE